MNKLDFNDVLTFGKHKGKDIKTIMEADPHYLEWLIDEEIVNFKSRVISELMDVLQEEDDDYPIDYLDTF